MEGPVAEDTGTDMGEELVGEHLHQLWIRRLSPVGSAHFCRRWSSWLASGSARERCVELLPPHSGRSTWIVVRGSRRWVGHSREGSL